MKGAGHTDTAVLNYLNGLLQKEEEEFQAAPLDHCVPASWLHVLDAGSPVPSEEKEQVSCPCLFFAPSHHLQLTWLSPVTSEPGTFVEIRMQHRSY